MANKIYDNFFLSNEISDLYDSHLDLQQFCTIDNSLEGTAGMLRKINRYTATAGAQKLAMGEGNSKFIEVTYAPFEYRIQLAQTAFKYFDEEAMTDPMIVQTGSQKIAADLFNTVNADVFAEFANGTQTISAASLGFDAFADAVAMLNIEGTDNDPSVVTPLAFAFVNPKDVAKIRKAAKDELKYVEAFVRSGYVGTLAGVNLYTKKNAVEGTVHVATRSAVTLFNKKGVEVVQPERDFENENVRANHIIARKYYLAALTDDTKLVTITVA